MESTAMKKLFDDTGLEGARHNQKMQSLRGQISAIRQTCARKMNLTDDGREKYMLCKICGERRLLPGGIS